MNRLLLGDNLEFNGITKMNIQIASSHTTNYEAKMVLKRLGLSQKKAIALFFEEIANRQDLPFSLPNFTKEKQLTVNVSLYEGIWTAECNALGLVTEAQSYEELTRRTLEIAPELAELNNVENFKLRFVQ